MWTSSRAPSVAACLAAVVAVTSCDDSGAASGDGPDRPNGRDSGGGDDDSTDAGDDETFDPAEPCEAGARSCLDGQTPVICAADGSEWAPQPACDEGLVCVRGDCLGVCEVAGKYENSNVSCEFWSLDLGQWQVREGELGLDPSVYPVPHSVVIGNPGTRPATIRFVTGEGDEVDVADPVVPAGAARSFTMPEMSLQDSGVSWQSIRVLSSEPVTASQFNPESNTTALHSTDASLLYPVGLMGREYYAVSLQSIQGPSLPGFPKSPDSLGWVTVLAVNPGVTRVSVTLTAPTAAGPIFPAHDAGQTVEVELQQFEVLNLNAAPEDALTSDNDLTGTRVVASQTVAVFSGHQCAVAGGGNCDHLEAQLLPVERWGTTYVAPELDVPNPNSIYRVVAATDGTSITTTPSVAGIDGATLNRGQWVETAAPGNFVIEGSHPIQVVQFIAGNNENESNPAAYLVDTSMSALVPTAQFRDSYALHVPSDFARDRLAIARPTGATVSIDGAPITSGWEAAGPDWEVAIVEVDDGVVTLDADAPIGVISYGFDHKVSYACSGGAGAPER